MLPRRKRIGKKLFEKILTNKGFFVDSSLFSLRVFSIQNEKDSRFACVVSKKNAQSAVERNRLRRLCYRVLSEIDTKTKIQLLGIVSLKKASLLSTHEEFSSQMKESLKKASQFLDGKQTNR